MKPKPPKSKIVQTFILSGDIVSFGVAAKISKNNGVSLVTYERKGTGESEENYNHCE